MQLGIQELNCLQQLLTAKPSETVILDISLVEGLMAEDEQFQVIVDGFYSLLTFLYTGKFSGNLTIYEIEVVQRLARCFGFLKLARKFGVTIQILQR